MTLEQFTQAVQDRTPLQFQARQARHHKSVYRTRAKYERSLTHQFTIIGPDSTELLCVRSHVIQPPFLFLFSDGALTTIWVSKGLFGAANINR